MGLGRIAADDQHRLAVVDVADASLVVHVVSAPQGGQLAEQIGLIHC